jgi:hypothetical protein
MTVLGYFKSLHCQHAGNRQQPYTSSALALGLLCVATCKENTGTGNYLEIQPHTSEGIKM